MLPTLKSAPCNIKKKLEKYAWGKRKKKSQSTRKFKIAHPCECTPMRILSSQPSGSLLINHTASKPRMLFIGATKPHGAKGKREVFCTQPQVLCTTPQLLSQENPPTHNKAGNCFPPLSSSDRVFSLQTKSHSTALPVHLNGIIKTKKQKRPKRWSLMLRYNLKQTQSWWGGKGRNTVQQDATDPKNVACTPTTL